MVSYGWEWLDNTGAEHKTHIKTVTLTHTHTCTHTLFCAACSRTIRLVSGFMVVLHPVKKRTRSHKTREKHEHLYCWQVYRDAAAASCRDQTGCWSCVSHAQILPLLTKHNISTQWNNSTEERVFLWCVTTFPIRHTSEQISSRKQSTNTRLWVSYVEDKRVNTTFTF